MSNLKNVFFGLDWMAENQSMAALVFFHWLESVEDLMVVLTWSRMDLLMGPMLFLAGLIRLHSTLLGSPYGLL